MNNSLCQTISLISKQVLAILYKNYRNHMSHKKKLMGQFIMPILISIIYIVVKEQQKGMPILAYIMSLLLKMYIGLVAISAVRQVITIFITERTQNFRQYQMIMGLSHRVHTLSNLFYMGLYMSFFLVPFYLTINYYELKLVYIFNFAAFVISSCTLSMALSSLFRDHKIALETIGMVFSLAAFLPLLYTQNGGLIGELAKQLNMPIPPSTDYTWVDYLAMIMPNSSFTISIVYGNSSSSLWSLFFVKFYFLLYTILEFPEFYKQKFSCCLKKMSKFSNIGNENNNLLEEFEMNEVIASDLNVGIEPNNRFENVAIKIENLSKSYKINKLTVNALHGVSFNVKRSEIFGLLGRNGAGKTTLVDILTGITKPSNGCCRFIPPVGVDEEKWQPSFGICYQHEVLYENLTVQQHLYFYSLIKCQSEKKEVAIERQAHIDKIIQTLGIESQRSKQAKQLSGGNKRKLSIAISILFEPEFLIFDEPTSGLDPLSRQYVWEVLQNLRKIYRCTIILTTHHLDEAQILSDWICVIEKGKILVENKSSVIKENYGKGYYLSIKDVKRQIKNFDFDIYRNIIMETKQLKCLQVQNINGELKILIKPFDKNIKASRFETQVIKSIEKLQNLKSKELHQQSVDQEVSPLRLSLRSNSLEQSFVSLIRDPDQKDSADSLDLNNGISRSSHLGNRMFDLKEYFCQLWGIFIKNIFYFKSVFLQASLIYNINIIIYVFANFFNKIMVETTKSSTDKEQVKDEISTAMNRPNPMILMNGYIIMASAYINCAVYQKEKKIRNMMNTRNLKGWVYWLGMFLFDYLMFCLNFSIIYFVASELVEMIGAKTILLTGIGMIFYAYCISFIFEKVKTANSWFSIFNIVIGFIIMPMVVFGKGTVFENFQFLKYVSPFYDMSVQAMFSSQNSMKQMQKASGIVKPETGIIGITITFYIILLIVLQYRLVQKVFFRKQEDYPQASQNMIQLDNVTKKYSKDITALSNVSYEVNQQRLALLGHNGAGKSTTFGLLSSQIHQSSGQIYIDFTRKPQYSKTLESAGICYQDDTLWEGMTVNQIMKIVSYVVKIDDHQKENKWLFENLEFDPNNAFKRFENLSGGNKRKLCMAIALYGEPSIRLLDECSTGLDPSSRLAMVDTVKNSKHGCTIFTTHSMGQAESLCSKTVIMTKGKVTEYDFINNLKDKYFDCFWIIIHCNFENQEQEQNLMKEFQQRKLTFVNKEKQKIKLEAKHEEICLSELLYFLHKLKEQKNISFYEIVEPKLEDVYLKVTREDQQNQQNN